MKKINLQTGLLLLNTLIGLIILLRLLTPAPVAAKEPPAVGAPPKETALAAPIRTSMFAWEEETFVSSERSEFFTVVEELGVDAIYQYVAKDKMYTADFKRFMRETARLGKQVFYLSGEAAWGFEPSARSMRREIDRVAAFNKATSGAKFAGIVFDVEPYLDDRWNKGEGGVMQEYVAVMQAAYQHAQGKGVTMAICLPYWYDNFAAELETLISGACDAVLVMNYDRADEQENIRLEVELAKKYGKRIESIFEFQDVGKHELTENETYATVGIEQAKKSFEKLEQAFGYDALGFSYHYYIPVRDMLGAS